MSEVILQARRREPGRSAARQLRRERQVPGIFYFHGEEPIAIVTAELALRPLIFTTESHLVRMKLDDGVEKTCVLKAISFDPITDRPVHFDLQGIAAGVVMRVEVPVTLVGQSIGQRNGGVVEFTLHKLEIECLPKNMPDHIEVDISELNIGDSIHVADVKVADAVILTNADLGVVSIAQPRVEMEPSATEGVSAEPELITKAKED